MLTAQTFSYADPSAPLHQKIIIRSIERLTGQLKVWRLYREYQQEYTRTQESFWEAAIRKLDLTVNYDRAKLAAIPKTGPLVVVANHPYGVLDGVIITQLMMQVRDDFKVLTNSVLCQAPEAAHHLLPIDFSGTPGALKTNITTRRAARDILKNGGCITVFPAGGVSTIPTFRDKVAQDTAWQPFIGKLIQESGATVVPVFFEGQNSRVFQIASLASPTLRLALFMKEVVDKIGSAIGVVIGDPVPYEELGDIEDRALLCHELRARCYHLGGMDTTAPPKAAYRLEKPHR